MAYKFEQEGVLSEGADAASETQDEHDSSDDNEEPHGVEAPEVCDGRQVRQDALRERKKNAECGYSSNADTFKISPFYRHFKFLT